MAPMVFDEEQGTSKKLKLDDESSEEYHSQRFVFPHQLMTTPNIGDLTRYENGQNFEPEYSRKQFEYEHSNNFMVTKPNFSTQFASLYYQRLHHLKGPAKENAQKVWQDCPPFVDRLLQVKTGELCCLIGTLFKEMPLKQNTLDEFFMEKAITAMPLRDKYNSENDKFTLEDESGRADLTGNVPTDTAITGVVIVVCGREVGEFFQVEKYCFPGLAPQIRRPLSTHLNPSPGDKYVALVSGMEIGSKTESSFYFRLLVEYITGLLGGEEEQEFGSNIVKLIVAGNSIASTACIDAAKDIKNQKKKTVEEIKGETSSPIRELDSLLSELVSSIPVSLMPGESDPANYILPQQPMHHCLFPKTGNYPSEMFETVTNPYSAAIENIEFLGTSGQNIDDIYKYVPCSDRMELIESTLQYRHIAPTAPDTLGCYPYTRSDPFVIQNTPNVYFIGNQPEFQQKYIADEDTKIYSNMISLPSFSKTKTLVLVNLSTLQAHPVVFG